LFEEIDSCLKKFSPHPPGDYAKKSSPQKYLAFVAQGREEQYQANRNLNLGIYWEIVLFGSILS
jgi:hypothetical protein